MTGRRAGERRTAVAVAFGLTGSGGMARVHAEAIAHGARGTRLIAIAGGTRATGPAAHHGIRADPSVEALLARPGIDAVVIATPHPTHLSLVWAAAAAGKHVFLEKPMGLDVAECDAMIEACRAADVRLMVAHITRFLEATWVAKALLDDGAIGTLRMISVHRILNGYPSEGWTLDPHGDRPGSTGAPTAAT